MPLFTDGLPASTSDLAAVESTILATASSEGLDIRQKLVLAHAQLGRELSMFLVQQGYLSAGRDLSCVFVDDNLRHAHALHALAVTYRDLASRRVQDRYEEKAKFYERSAAVITSQALEAGIGVSSSPLRAPLGLTVRAVSGGTRPPRRLHVRAATVGSGVVTSAWTPAEVIDLDGGQLAEVGVAMDAAVGCWVLYGSYAEEGYKLQTPTPLPRHLTWSEPSTGLLDSAIDLPVQTPDRYVHLSRRLLRG